MCIDCTAKLPAVKRAKEQCAQRAVSTEIRGRKRRVLGDTDPNVAAESASACTERACTMGYGFTAHERTDEIEGR